jgi:hypothetical protein
LTRTRVRHHGIDDGGLGRIADVDRIDAIGNGRVVGALAILVDPDFGAAKLDRHPADDFETAADLPALRRSPPLPRSGSRWSRSRCTCRILGHKGTSVVDLCHTSVAFDAPSGAERTQRLAEASCAEEVKWTTSPVRTVEVPGSIATLPTVPPTTSTLTVLVALPALPVMVAVPGDTAVRRPSGVIRTTFGFDEVNAIWS